MEEAKFQETNDPSVGFSDFETFLANGNESENRAGLLHYSASRGVPMQERTQMYSRGNVYGPTRGRAPAAGVPSVLVQFFIDGLPENPSDLVEVTMAVELSAAGLSRVPFDELSEVCR